MTEVPSAGYGQYGYAHRDSSESNVEIQNMTMPQNVQLQTKPESSALQRLGSGALWVAGGIAKILVGIVAYSAALSFTVALLGICIARGVLAIAAKLIGFIPGLGSHILEPLIGKLGAFCCGLGARICVAAIMQSCEAIFANSDNPYIKEFKGQLYKGLSDMVKEIGTYTARVEQKVKKRDSL